MENYLSFWVMIYPFYLVESKGNETDFLRRLSRYKGTSVFLKLGEHFIQGGFVSDDKIFLDGKYRLPYPELAKKEVTISKK